MPRPIPSRSTPWLLVALALLAWAAGARPDRPAVGVAGPEPTRRRDVAPAGRPASDLRARPVATGDAPLGQILPGKEKQDGPDALAAPRDNLADPRGFRRVAILPLHGPSSVPSPYPLRC